MRAAGSKIFAMAALLGLFLSLHLGDLCSQSWLQSSRRVQANRSFRVARGEVEGEHHHEPASSVGPSSGLERDEAQAGPAAIVAACFAVAAPCCAIVRRATDTGAIEEPTARRLPEARAPPPAA